MCMSESMILKPFLIVSPPFAGLRLPHIMLRHYQSMATKFCLDKEDAPNENPCVRAIAKLSSDMNRHTLIRDLFMELSRFDRNEKRIKSKPQCV